MQKKPASLISKALSQKQPISKVQALIQQVIFSVNGELEVTLKASKKAA